MTTEEIKEFEEWRDTALDWRQKERVFDEIFKVTHPIIKSFLKERGIKYEKVEHQFDEFDSGGFIFIVYKFDRTYT